MAQDIAYNPGDTFDPDELLGEAVEAYLTQAESGLAPEPEAFAASYPEGIRGDLVEAIEGLSLVRGLVGSPGIGGPAGRRLVAGRRLAGYRILGELGSGGMGVVYEAVHVDLDRPVALKVLDARAMRPGSSGLQRFLNEAKTAAGLHHTHIVPVFDVGHVGGLCYYAMQRIEGSGLDRVVKALRRGRSTAAGSGLPRAGSRRLSSWTRSIVRSRPRDAGLSIPSLDAESAAHYERPADRSAAESLAAWSSFAGGSAEADSGHRHHPAALTPDDDLAPPFQPPRGAAYYRWVADIGRQAADALAYAHLKGIIHRDVKPSNLLIDASGSIWVTDFGLARRLAEPGLTQVESLVGTPRYMSPEQTRSGPIDCRTDVYSLGATLYELLTLHPPFEGRTTAELFEQIGRRDPVSPRKFDPRIPRDLETIVLKALSQRPADRYPDAQALADDLDHFLQFEPVRARRIGIAGRLWRLARRHPAITAVSTVATALVLATATFAYLRVVQERDRAVSAEQGAKDLLREHLLSQASLMRISPVPDRRSKGLELLRDGANRKPTADQRARLQAEAIAFLSLRDVERRTTWPTSGWQGLAPAGADGTFLTLSDDRLQVLTWTPSSATSASAVAAGPSPPSQAEASPGGGPPEPPGWGSNALFRRLASAGGHTAVIWPDGRGLRLFTGNPSRARFRDLPTPDRDLVSLRAVASSAGLRLLLTERLPEPAGDGPPPGPGGGRDRDRDRDHGPGGGRSRQLHRVTLWDPAQPWESGPLATLAEPASDPLQTDAFAIPLIAVATGSDRLALTWLRASEVRLFNARDGQQEPNPLDTRAPIWTMAVTPHGQLATASAGVVRLWDLNTHAPLTSLSPQQGWIFHLEYSDDGSLLAVAGPNNDVELWDPVSAQLVAALPTSDRVTGLGFDPAGRWLVIGQPEATQLWAIVEPDVQERSAGLPDKPSSLAFQADGSLAVSFRGDEPARLWVSSPVPGLIPAFDEETRPGSFVRTADGQLAALAGPRLVWYAPGDRSGKPVRSLPLETGPGRMSFQGYLVASADGRALVVQTRQGPQYLWHIAQPDRLREIHLHHPAPDGPRPAHPKGAPGGPPPPPPSDSAPDGSRSRAGGGGASRPASDGPPRNRGGSSGFVFGLSSRGDRLYLVRPGDTPGSRQFGVWTLATARDAGLQVQSARWFDSEPTSAGPLALPVIAPDGLRMAAPRPDGRIALVDLATGTERSILPQIGDPGEPLTLAFAPDGRSLAVGDREGGVRLWRLAANGAPEGLPLVLPGHRGAVLCLAFDPATDRLATAGDDQTLIVWDLDRLATELTRLGLGHRPLMNDTATAQATP